MNYFFTLIIYTLIILLFPFCVQFALNRKEKAQRIWFIILISLLAAIFVGFRGQSGTDTVMYMANYEFGSTSVTRWVEMEKGFILLNQVFRKFGVPVEFFFIFISFLTNFFALLSIDKLRDYINVYVASFVYFTTIYFQSFNIIRQTLAVSICLYAYVLFMDKKYIASVILILIAAQIHRTAYLCLVIIIAGILFKGRKSKWTIGIVMLMLLILVMHRNSFGNLVLALTHNQYYAGYILRDSGSSSSFITYYLKISPVLIISFLNWKNYRSNPKFLVLFGLMLMGYILSSLGVYTSTEVNRIGLYFTALNIIIMGYCANNNITFDHLKILLDKRVITTLIIIYFFCTMIFGIFIQKNNQIVPYRSNPSLISNGGI